MEEEMEDFKYVVNEILDTYNSNWPENITDLVFVAIEKNPYYLQRYYQFTSRHYSAPNPLIGKYVKEYTGKKAGKQNRNPQSKLIASFTMLE
jgi:hypothetical protein